MGSSIKSRLNRGLEAYRTERKKQTEEEITKIKAKAKKINAKAKEAEEKKRAKASVQQAKNRLLRAKGKGGKR